MSVVSTQRTATAILHTNRGDISIDLFGNHAPQTVDNFVGLAKGTKDYSERNASGGEEGPFYDGAIFHRVIDGFMAQTGCPQGTGMGGSGKKLKAEFNAEPHVRGTASMARAANPDSGDSQFFICFDDARFLDKQYTVWGKVTEGMDNVDKIKRGEPVQNPDKIVKAYMAADAA